MNGILVVNAYWNSPKADELHHYLAESADKAGITLRVRTNEAMLFSDERPDFVLFWDKDVHLARRLEKQGVPVFNSARAIALCDDKAKTYTELLGVVPQPETIIAPLSFAGADYTAFVRQAAARLGLPLVFKECFGSFGEQVFLCRSEADVLSHITQKPFLLQEYIECGGEDVRMEVVGGKVVAAMRRQNPHDFRANLTSGGTAAPYEPTAQEATLAVKACTALGLDFGGVDLLDGRLVCEVNSNAHIINLKNVTGIDAAPLIFEHIKKNV